METLVRLINILAFGLLAATQVHAEEWTIRRQLQGNFDEVKEAIVTAIENRGLVINYTSHMADMLKRTGSDLGSGRLIYDRAEIVEFCSASLSRRMMETDPHNIVLCPFSLSIYQLPGESRTWVAYRKPMGSAAEPVADMLRGIVAEAGE